MIANEENCKENDEEYRKMEILEIIDGLLHFIKWITETQPGIKMYLIPQEMTSSLGYENECLAELNNRSHERSKYQEKFPNMIFQKVALRNEKTVSAVFFTDNFQEVFNIIKSSKDILHFSRTLFLNLDTFCRHIVVDFISKKVESGLLINLKLSEIFHFLHDYNISSINYLLESMIFNYQDKQIKFRVVVWVLQNGREEWMAIVHTSKLLNYIYNQIKNRDDLDKIQTYEINNSLLQSLELENVKVSQVIPRFEKKRPSIVTSSEDYIKNSSKENIKCKSASAISKKHFNFDMINDRGYHSDKEEHYDIKRKRNSENYLSHGNDNRYDERKSSKY